MFCTWINTNLHLQGANTPMNPEVHLYKANLAFKNRLDIYKVSNVAVRLKKI